MIIGQDSSLHDTYVTCNILSNFLQFKTSKIHILCCVKNIPFFPVAVEYCLRGPFKTDHIFRFVIAGKGRYGSEGNFKCSPYRKKAML